MHLSTILLFLLGLILLVVGAEFFVRGAARLAARFRVPSLVIGLTVVAFGTSAPELSVSLRAGLGGQPDIALGNVLGSNIFNILFILGLSALIVPLRVDHQLIRLDVPLMIAASGLVLLLGWDGRIGRLDGLFLFCALLAYTVFLIWQARKDSHPPESAAPSSSPPGRAWSSHVLHIAAGLGLLVLGAGWLVDSAAAIARSVGASELVIGLTIVAAGTSLPEVATSVVASLRGERDIAVGNVVGSNIFNIGAVLGLAALVAPAGLAVSAPALHFDIPVMIAVAVACLPVFSTGHLIARWEGLLFLGYYLAYTGYLILHATRHPALPLLSTAMVGFVIPLTVITLGLVTWRSLSEPKCHENQQPSGRS